MRDAAHGSDVGDDAATGAVTGDAPDAAALARALAADGIDAEVEARARLAVLVPRGDVAGLVEPARRRALHRLAVAHGFTHLALELRDDDEGGGRAHAARGGAGTPPPAPGTPR